MENIEKLLAFLKEAPGDPFLKHALALEYIKAGRDEAARGLFIEILTADPDYVGSYYHLAGLLDRTGDREGAISWYEQGMAAAKRKGDQHAFNELRSAYEDLL
jgi:tetratricopeptide (TPR) repeat protein